MYSLSLSLSLSLWYSRALRYINYLIYKWLAIAISLEKSILGEVRTGNSLSFHPLLSERVRMALSVSGVQHMGRPCLYAAALFMASTTIKTSDICRN